MHCGLASVHKSSVIMPYMVLFVPKLEQHTPLDSIGNACSIFSLEDIRKLYKRDALFVFYMFLYKAKEQMDCQVQIQATKDNVAKKDQEILRLENQLKETEQILVRL